MSALLLDQAIAHVRASFTRAQVAEVREYAGEFSAEEVAKIPFNVPCILIACLGWKAEKHGSRLVGRMTRDVRLAAFIVTKHVDREQRMRQALMLAEALCVVLRLWVPEDVPELLQVAGLEDDPRAENLYSRGIDALGMALWLVDWHQCVKPLAPPARLFDLLAIDITDHTVQGTPDTAAAPGVAPTVTEDVQFNTLPPAA